MIISIDGNIGSGKSSGLQYLHNEFSSLGLRCFPEPVALWRNVEGTDLLAECYSKNESYTCFRTQTYIMSTMAKLYSDQIEDNSILIFERSIFSAQKIFAQNFFYNTSLSRTDFGILEQQFELFKQLTPVPDVFIYLRCDPETCLERINYRGNLESGGTVSLEYLQNIHKLYDQFFLEDNDRQIPMLRIVDGSGTEATVRSLLTLTIEDILAERK